MRFGGNRKWGVLAAIFLGVEHPHQQNTRRGHNRTPRLQQQVTAQGTEDARDHVCVFDRQYRLFLGVADANTSAEIQVAELDARIGELLVVTGETRERLAERGKAEYLRSDMGADALPFDPARFAVLQIDAPGPVPIQAKFMGVVAGGNMRMATRGHVGIYSNCGRGLATRAVSFFDKQIEFGFGFDIE